MFWHHGQKLRTLTNFKKFLQFSLVANGGQTDLEEMLLNLETCCNYNPNHLTNGLFPHKLCPHTEMSKAPTNWRANGQLCIKIVWTSSICLRQSKIRTTQTLASYRQRVEERQHLTIPVPEQIGVARLKLSWSSSHVNESESEVSMQPWQRMSDYSIEY